MIAYVRSLDPKGALAGAAAMLLLGGGIVLGSRSFRTFDPVLLTYAFGVLFSAFAVAYRYAVWLQRPPTRVAVRRGFALLRRGNPLRNLVYVIRLLGGTFAAQHFIRKRSFVRWFVHFLIAWGTMIAGAVTFPLVFGWLCFATRLDDPSIYRIVLFGFPVGEFGTESVLRYLMFNLLNISALMVITGAGLALHRRLKEPANLSRQQFGNDIVPLLLLLAISITGLALTFSTHFLHGAGYAVLSLVHALTVSITLLYLPFGKFFHIFQRPLHLAILLRRRDEATAPAATCTRCGRAFAGAEHLADLQEVLRETGLRLGVGLCPSCKRRRLGLAQRLVIEGSRSRG
ncbi:MAG TPA: MFS transporter [Planctomycetota bacterium]|nr:MFS transporter [Planctomycetota bacterium]